MAKTSVIIPHWPWGEEIQEKLRQCVQSLSGADEVLIVVNDKIGFAKAVNQGLRSATGDYLIVLNNDTIVSGDLHDLCIEGTVTSPLVNGMEKSFWGACFCIPREVYEKVGGLDEDFKVGYFEDDAYIITLERAGVPMGGVRTVNISTQGGATMQTLEDRDEIFKTNQEIFRKKYGNSSNAN